MSEPKILLPVGLVVEIFNAIPVNNKKLRNLLIEYLRTYKNKVEEKGHVAEGFRLLDNETLTFEESLYDEAVYRGKIETYSRGTYEYLEKLRDEIDILKTMGEKHQNKLAAVPSESLEQRVGIGRPISSQETALLNKILPVLLTISESTNEKEKELT
jgi:hypothetical protein